MKSKYELVVVFKSAADDKQKQQVKDLLKKIGATKIKEENLGNQQLAYPIQNQTQAVYVKYNFIAEGNIKVKVDNFFYLNKDKFLRYLLVRQNDK